ncbi:MAG: RidA family protein [Pseudomonadota bacterium]|nr:RidA family protein [Pseudomonadota bacterium]MEC8675756.1 RidA family protein [Pseudomonadota bacterium]
MHITPINPAHEIYPATADYVHAMQVTAPTRWLFISGTMGLANDSRAAATLDGQLALIWHNIRRILQEAEMAPDNIVRVTSYLTDAAYAEANQNAREVALGHRPVATTAVIVGTLNSDWLVEVEAIAAA